MAPKVVPGTIFLEISETLIFDDSTMIFMVFQGPEGSQEPPKTGKNHQKVRPWTKYGQETTQMRKNCTESGPQGAHGAEKKRKRAPRGRPRGPCHLTASPRRRPDAIPTLLPARVFNTF